MPQPRHFRYPIHAIERFGRKVYSDALHRLGFVPHSMPAQGARFLVDTADYIDSCIAYDGMWEAPQLEFLAEVATTRNIDLFLDIGANTGFYGIMFAVKRLTPEIIAFEPDPGNFARLNANLKASNLEGAVVATPLALGDRDSDVVLHQGATWNRGESTIAVPEQTPREVAFTVRQIRFDDEYSYSGKSIIIKIDVEGYEFNTIAGLERTLRQNACLLQIELYSDRFEELKALLSGLGYRYLHTEYIDHFFTNMTGELPKPA